MSKAEELARKISEITTHSIGPDAEDEWFAKATAILAPHLAGEQRCIHNVSLEGTCALCESMNVGQPVRLVGDPTSYPHRGSADKWSTLEVVSDMQTRLQKHYHSWRFGDPKCLPVSYEEVMRVCRELKQLLSPAPPEGEQSVVE